MYALDAAGKLVDTGIRTPPKIDTSPYTSLEVKAPSEDGTLVPLSIVMRRDAKLDGTNPVYIEAYGSYGIDIDPYFLGSRFSWLDAGGIWAVAHVRGGGQLGEAGISPQAKGRQRCIHRGRGRRGALPDPTQVHVPEHLAIEGTSAGGIMVGGAITQHPELFAAALDVVGWTDGLRSEAAEPNGAGNVPEFGSPKTQQGFDDLYKMDAYQHVVDGTKYPAVMAVTGINDPRVAPWQPAKFVARLRRRPRAGGPSYCAWITTRGTDSRRRLARNRSRC